MAANPELYEEWKRNTKYSHAYTTKKIQDEEEQKLDEAKKKFFGCTEIDDKVREERLRQEKEAKSVFNLKKQFLLEQNQSTKPVHHFDDNIDFQTTNTFYHGLTKNSVQTQLAHPVDSPVLNDLDPEVFEVTAKRENPIWRTSTYKDPEFRGELNQTTKNVAHGFDTDMAEKLHVNKFNKRITVISEYSNALHNGRVFKNPRFTSC